MIHVSGTDNPNFHAIGAHYINADTTAFMRLPQEDPFGDFPELRLVIPRHPPLHRRTGHSRPGQGVRTRRRPGLSAPGREPEDEGAVMAAGRAGAWSWPTWWRRCELKTFRVQADTH